MEQHPLLAGMNSQQIAAITAGPGPVLVLAGPGSGKTAVLTRRIAWLIQEQGIPHHRIMAVTFTNKAAGEMRERVEGLLGEPLRGMQISTFHSACARFLRRDAKLIGYRPNYVIYDTDDQVALIKRIMKLLNIDSKLYRPRRILHMISRAKSDMTLPANFRASDYIKEIVRQVYVAYQHALSDANAMDFDDLLLNMYLLMRKSDAVRHQYQGRYGAVLVDEFQDTNAVQYELVKLFAAPQNNVFVVGDEDQSIYSFRGVNYRNLLEFRCRYPSAQQFLLKQNYRSTQHILNFARAVIDCNPDRTPKALFSDLGLGERVRLTELYDNDYQAEYVLEQIHRLRQREGLGYKDIAVMYRANWLSRAIEQKLVRENIPYVVIGGVGFYMRREVKDMLAYLRLISNPDDRVSFERIINTPRRGIGDKSVSAFFGWLTQANITLRDALGELIDFPPKAIPTAARKKFQQFAVLLDGWRKIAATGELIALFNDIVAQTGYAAYLQKISKSEEEYDERWGNVHEIWTMLQRVEEIGQSLEDFLMEQTLFASVDELQESDEKVTLITLHSAKGLEFPAVFIVSVEEDVLPHARSLAEPGGLEEERRLFYVGITRAKRFLQLSYTFVRGPSEFLSDVPPELLAGAPTTLAMLRRGQSSEAQTQWPRPASRLAQDLRSGAVSRPNQALRQKIKPFPGASSAGDGQKKESAFKIGARVKHPQFGPGLVIGSEAGGIVSVLFERQGLKKVLIDAEGFEALD